MNTTKPLNIILAEDNVDHAELMIETLEELNTHNRITHVHNGKELLAFLEETLAEGSEFTPDIILLDIKMPLLGGIETLASIKKNPAFKKLPVIMVTTSKNDKEISICYELGASSYITKPLHFEDFVRKMRELNKYWVNTTELPH
jgi:CheY-like chemotaxis protein